MKKNLKFTILFLPFFILADMGQMLPGQIQGELTFEEDLKGESAFVKVEDEIQNFKNVDESSFSVKAIDTIKKTNLNKRDSLTSFNQKVLGEEANSSYFEADDKKRFKEISNQSSSSLSFYYIKDDYDYKSENDVFERTFSNTTGSIKGGSFLISVDRYFTKGGLNLSWGGNLGFGYNSGKGIFVDGLQSDTTFRLWTLPIELSFGIEVPVSTWFKLSGTAGPSVLGVIQNRSDKENGSAEKERRQVGTGYFAEGKFSVNIGNIMKSQMVRLFSEYKMTDVYLDLVLRTQQYSNFKDSSFEVSGSSFGLGLSFDYL